MGRAAYLAFIAAVFLTGGYFAFFDIQTLAKGSLPSAIASYEAIVCLVSAAALFLDFRTNNGDENALVN